MLPEDFDGFAITDVNAGGPVFMALDLIDIKRSKLPDNKTLPTEDEFIELINQIED